MKTSLCVSLILGSLLTMLAAGSGDDAKAIQGTWKPARAEFAGQAMNEAALKNISLKLKDGNYEAFVGLLPDRGTYKLEAATTPKSISITGTAGPNQGKTFLAIYELTGDMLRICYDLSGAERPKEFKTATGTKLYLVTYQRAQEAPPAAPGK